MSRELLLRETLRLPWSEVLSQPLVPTKVLVARDPADIIGVVVPLRGRWWGMAVVRCDRGIPEEIAAQRGTGRYADFDAAMRWLGLEVAKAVRRTVDVTAELGDAIVLAGDETMWVPSNAKLYSEASFKCGERTLVVSAYERTRSDRRASIVPPVVRDIELRETEVRDIAVRGIESSGGKSSAVVVASLHVETPRPDAPASDPIPPQLPKVIVNPHVRSRETA